MPSQPETSDLANIASEHSGEYLRLLKSWQRQTGHNWIFAGVESSHTRDELVAHLDAADAAEHAPPAAHLHVPKGTSPVALVELVAALDIAVPRAHLLFPYDWSPDAAWWQQCNTQRERLANAFPKQLVFWLPDECITLAARNAPDFWNWRGAVMTFLPQPVVFEREFQTAQFDYRRGQSKLEVQARLDDIEKYLTAYETSNNASASLLVEASNAYEQLGEYEKAIVAAQLSIAQFESVNNEIGVTVAKSCISDINWLQGNLDEALKIRLTEVLPIYKKLNHSYGIAVTLGKVADIYTVYGKLEDALNMLQKEVLPIFIKLEKIHDVAITKGKIADIHLIFGRTNEALNIRQNEEIPIYEKLGDIYSVAVTKGQVADIYFAKGRLDEALSIRLKEQLPVYEKLGDIRSQAITMGKIADIYQTRGQLDEALSIRLNEVLPVLEKIADLREIAMNKIKIGEIYVAKGKLRQALSLYKLHALPSFVQMNAVRDMQATKSRIAALEKRLATKKKRK
jgi:tetratricopeptide (TPR) repeat protein